MESCSIFLRSFISIAFDMWTCSLISVCMRVCAVQIRCVQISRRSGCWFNKSYRMSLGIGGWCSTRQHTKLKKSTKSSIIKFYSPVIVQNQRGWNAHFQFPVCLISYIYFLWIRHDDLNFSLTIRIKSCN